MTTAYMSSRIESFMENLPRNGKETVSPLVEPSQRRPPIGVADNATAMPEDLFFIYKQLAVDRRAFPGDRGNFFRRTWSECKFGARHSRVPLSHRAAIPARSLIASTAGGPGLATRPAAPRAPSRRQCGPSLDLTQYARSPGR